GLGEVGHVADQVLDLVDLHDYLRLRLAGGRRFWFGRELAPCFAVARFAASSEVAAISPAPTGTAAFGRWTPPPARCGGALALCRSFSTVRIGAAMKIDEYAPIATPMNIANAKFFNVSPPNSSSDRIGSSTTSEVFTDRITVWFSERSTTFVYP